MYGFYSMLDGELAGASLLGIGDWGDLRGYTGADTLLQREAIYDGFTKKYNIDRLVYYEYHESSESAIAREKEIKGWSREKKSYFGLEPCSFPDAQSYPTR